MIFCLLSPTIFFIYWKHISCNIHSTKYFMNIDKVSIIYHHIRYNVFSLLSRFQAVFKIGSYCSVLNNRINGLGVAGRIHIHTYIIQNDWFQCTAVIYKISINVHSKLGSKNFLETYRLLLHSECKKIF